MTSIAPRSEHIPPTPKDAMVATLPIPQDLANVLAHRLMRTTRREGRCWVRNEGYRKANGYSYITKTVNGVVRHYAAHRVIYVHYFGLIPDGYTVDHLCENPPCLNPKHLQVVTHRQNVLRSRTNPFAVNARRTRERREGVK